MVDRDDHVAGLESRRPGARHRTGEPLISVDVVAQEVELRDEQLADATRELAREHVHRAPPIGEQLDRRRAASSGSTASSVVRTLSRSAASVRDSTSLGGRSRMRSVAGRSASAISSCTAACSCANPENPSFAANRSTVGPLVPECAASWATVPKATIFGSSATAGATLTLGRR